jgi:hypothetical protein
MEPYSPRATRLGMQLEHHRDRAFPQLCGVVLPCCHEPQLSQKSQPPGNSGRSTLNSGNADGSRRRRGDWQQRHQLSTFPSLPSALRFSSSYTCNGVDGHCDLDIRMADDLADQHGDAPRSSSSVTHVRRRVVSSAEVANRLAGRGT